MIVYWPQIRWALPWPEALLGRDKMAQWQAQESKHPPQLRQQKKERKTQSFDTFPLDEKFFFLKLW